MNAKAGFESGARAALKAEIAARDAAEVRVEGARKALDRIGDQIFDGQKRLRELRAERAEEASDRVRQIVAGGSATVLERVNGRQRESEIEAEIVALKEARDLVRVELREAEASLDLAVRRVADAVGALLASLAPRLIERAETARAEFISVGSVLRLLRSSVTDGLRRRIDEVTSYPVDFDGEPALAPWRAAAEALSRDANAALPE